MLDEYIFIKISHVTGKIKRSNIWKRKEEKNEKNEISSKIFYFIKNSLNVKDYMETTRPIGPHIITFGTPSWKPKFKYFWKNLLLAELINSFPETIALIKLLVAHFNLSRSATIHRRVLAHVFKVKYLCWKTYQLLLLRDRSPANN